MNREMLKNFSKDTPLYLTLLLALTIRTIGIDFGFPYFYLPEEWFFIPTAQRILVTGDLNPHWFGFPGSFITYLLAMLFAVILVFTSIFKISFGYVDSPNNFLTVFQKAALSYPLMFYLIGRLLMVLFAVITVYLVYLLCKKVFNRTIGILAALCMSIAPLHVVHSRYIRPDITTTMLVLISLYLLLKYTEQDQNQDLLILSSLFAGFSVATKYTSGIIVFPIFVHCLVMDGKVTRIFSMRYMMDFLKAKTRLSKALLYSFFGFFLFAPYVLLDWQHSLRDIMLEARSEHVGHERLPGIQNHIWYLTHALRFGIGGIFFEIFAGIGLFIVLLKKEYKKYLFLIFPIMYYIAIVGFGRLRTHRWLISVLPFEAMLFGVGFYSVYLYTTNRRKLQRYKRGLLFLFTGIAIYAFTLPAMKDIEYAVKLTRTDTRTLLRNWIEKNLPDGSKIAYEEREMRHNDIGKKIVYLFAPYGSIANVPLSFYEQQSVDYIIIKKGLKDSVYSEPEKYKVYIDRYKELEVKTELVKVFDNKDNPGPVIEVYRLRVQDR